MPPILGSAVKQILKMVGVVKHCAYNDCQKLLIRRAILPVGAYEEVKCAHCGRINCIHSSAEGISVQTEGAILTSRQKASIIIMSGDN